MGNRSCVGQAHREANSWNGQDQPRLTRRVELRKEAPTDNLFYMSHLINLQVINYPATNRTYVVNGCRSTFFAVLARG